MSLEHTKHMNEKDVHRDLPSVRDIRPLLLHCSPVTPNQQLKPSFQTFAALPADETRHLTSQTHPVLQDDLSDGSDRSGVIAKELLKSLILSAASLDDAVIDPWMQATRCGPVDFTEVCCTSDSLLSGPGTLHGGRPAQYSHWNGFDLTSRLALKHLKEDLLEKETASCVDDTSCTIHRTQQCQSVVHK